MRREDSPVRPRRRPNRPTVAVVTDAIYPYHRGGKEIRYFELLPRLGESFEVDVYTMHWWPEPSPMMYQGGVRYQAICPLFPLYNNVRRSMLEAVVFALSVLRLLTKQFDVVEADHMPYLHLFTLRLVATLRRRPLVVTWNEVWGPEYWRSYLGGISGRFAWWVERAAMSLPNQILAVSEGTAERLRNYVGHSVPIRVIQNAIDLDLVQHVAPARPEDAAELLYVGRLLEHKKVDLLLDAFAVVNDRRPSRLLVVGDGPERAKLLRRAALLGLGDAVTFRADVAEHAEVFALMKAASVFVFPSVREGFGIAPLEALACGARVVAVSHPDNQARHLVARSGRGHLSEPTVEGVARAIEEALAASAFLVAEDEQWLEEYDWRAVSSAYVEALGASLRSRGEDAEWRARDPMASSTESSAVTHERGAAVARR